MGHRKLGNEQEEKEVKGGFFIREKEKLYSQKALLLNHSLKKKIDVTKPTSHHKTYCLLRGLRYNNSKAQSSWNN